MSRGYHHPVHAEAVEHLPGLRARIDAAADIGMCICGLFFTSRSASSPPRCGGYLAKVTVDERRDS